MLMVHRAWPLVVPHTPLTAGLYLGLLIIAAVGGMGMLQSELATWGIAWWQRRRGAQPLSAHQEALLILCGLTLVWLVTLALILLLARAFPA